MGHGFEKQVVDLLERFVRANERVAAQVEQRGLIDEEMATLRRIEHQQVTERHLLEVARYERLRLIEEHQLRIMGGGIDISGLLRDSDLLRGRPETKEPPA